MQVRFKSINSNSVLPTYSKIGDAGLDLTCTNWYLDEHGNYVYQTGLAVEIPEGYVGLIYPRSSIMKTSHALSNSVGVIDSGYRGEILVVFRRATDSPRIYTVGDRIAQLVIMPYPTITPVWSDTLSNTERGGEGFGSTGQ